MLRSYVVAEIERRVTAGARYRDGHSRIGAHSVVFVCHGSAVGPDFRATRPVAPRPSLGSHSSSRTAPSANPFLATFLQTASSIPIATP